MVATVGHISAFPSAHNVISGEARLGLDLCHGTTPPASAPLGSCAQEP